MKYNNFFVCLFFLIIPSIVFSNVYFFSNVIGEKEYFFDGENILLSIDKVSQYTDFDNVVKNDFLIVLQNDIDKYFIFPDNKIVVKNSNKTYYFSESDLIEKNQDFFISEKLLKELFGIEKTFKSNNYYFNFKDYNYVEPKESKSYIMRKVSGLDIYEKGYFYSVQSNDSILKISNKTGISVQVLVDRNEDIVYSKYLYKDQKLFIPEKNVFYYKVRSKDTLNILSKYYFTDTANIKWDNSKKFLYVGEIIEIPAESIGLSYNRNQEIGWPVIGVISSLYGYRIHPIYKTRKFHSGLDIAAPEGIPVMASTEGKVVEVGYDEDGYGRYVKVSYNNRFYMYGHMSKILVPEGYYLNKGETLGLVGSTGLSTGPHVHFEVRYSNNSTIDPLKVLKKNMQDTYLVNSSDYKYNSGGE
jgi:murein DD-endopeptidase MepM/ murein hydrolase activator NlpD